MKTNGTDTPHSPQAWLYALSRRFSFLRRVVPGPLKRLLFRGMYRLPDRKPYRPGAHPNGVNLYGFLTAALGLGKGARLYAAALEAGKMPHALLDAGDLLERPPEEQQYADNLSQEATYSTSVIHLNPDMLPLLFSLRDSAQWDERYLVGVWLWELPRIPEDWQKYLSVFDEFWAPSRFIAGALAQETEKPVVYMPYGIEEPKGAERFSRAHFGLPEHTFLALCMFDLNSYAARKNPQGAARAFAKAFPGDAGDACLVVKVHNATEQDLLKIRETVDPDTRLLFINQRLDSEEVAGLIACCDTLISLHRSEGFGLILAEAMALAVPVVATNWSANTDFMDADSACMVQYTLVSTEGAYLGGQTDQLWADPDLDQAAEYLRRLYTDADFRRRIGRAGQEKVRRELSIAQCAGRIERRLAEIWDKKDGG